MKQEYKFDLYEALGLDIDATQSEIKKSYRRLVFLLHPDRNNGLGLESKLREEAMRGINYAYDILSKTDRRKDYDFTVYSCGLRLPEPIFYGLVKMLNGELGSKSKVGYSPILEKKQKLSVFEEFEEQLNDIVQHIITEETKLQRRLNPLEKAKAKKRIADLKLSFKDVSEKQKECQMQSKNSNAWIKTFLEVIDVESGKIKNGSQ